MIWFASLAALAGAALIVAWRTAVRARAREADDAAERARLVARVEALQNNLISSTRLASLGNLVAGLVHEINTPMGALHSNHDVLMRALERLQLILADEIVEPHELEEVRRIVRAVNDVIKVNTMAVERVTGLVKNLRNFGRPDRSEIGYADLHEGIDSTLAIIKHQLGDRIEIVRDYGDLPPLFCRPQQLNQVWMNLLVNARQAIRERGGITIRTSSDGDQIRVAVSDTGVGIPDAHKAQLFEPGFTTKGSRIGMGMGLLITRQIVEQHGGAIAIHSEVGRGTTMIVTLPLKSSPIAAAATAS